MINIFLILINQHWETSSDCRDHPRPGTQPGIDLCCCYSPLKLACHICGLVKTLIVHLEKKSQNFDKQNNCHEPSKYTEGCEVYEWSSCWRWKIFQDSKKLRPVLFRPVKTKFCCCGQPAFCILEEFFYLLQEFYILQRVLH